MLIGFHFIDYWYYLLKQRSHQFVLTATHLSLSTIPLLYLQNCQEKTIQHYYFILRTEGPGAACNF
jgi:hypothetical protein